LVGTPEAKKPLERLRCRWEDNIRMNFWGNRVERSGLNSSDSGWRPVADSCEHGFRKR
jgi:hypothetical protein